MKTQHLSFFKHIYLYFHLHQCGDELNGGIETEQGDILQNYYIFKFWCHFCVSLHVCVAANMRKITQHPHLNPVSFQFNPTWYERGGRWQVTFRWIKKIRHLSSLFYSRFKVSSKNVQANGACVKWVKVTNLTIPHILRVWVSFQPEQKY